MMEIGEKHLLLQVTQPTEIVTVLLHIRWLYRLHGLFLN